MSIDRIGIHFGSFTVHFYGIILMLGVVAAAFLADREAKRRNKDPEFLWDALIWLVIGGVIGARLWHIFTPPPSMVEDGITTNFYLTHPLDALAIWEGGLGIPGAVIGGGFALYVFAKSRRQNFLIWADIIVPGLALGQAIGRWGNYVNQELYGAPAPENLPWKIFIEWGPRLTDFKDVEYYHPLFLYESLWNLANMFLLLWIAKRFVDVLKPGDLFLVYLITYPVARILLDFVRLDASEVAGINANQTFMIVILLSSIGLLVYRHKYAKRPESA
ncbi:MAG: prolipoprotein diacylglyceryl transferase [Chloroflexi bacterium]|nr:prolipoprotein diacylglyceryl transferase [Chloroflexota bacterium]